MGKIPLNKGDLVDMLAENAELTKISATKVLNSLVEIITLSLRTGRSVPLLGFGTFSVKPRAARIGRNPKTGEPIQIQAANVPVFKAGKSLKDAVNCGSVVEEKV